jgi:hypothetical protein
MTAPPDETSPELIEEARTRLMAAVHGLAPNVPLIDCAVLVNGVLDDVANGDLRSTDLMLHLFQGVLDASERARRGTQ